MIVWLTGLSGAGKTTIADAIIRIMKPILPNLIVIDGDVIRELFGADLGFDVAARKVQIGRIQRLALFLTRQDVPVIVSALYASHDLLEWNRANLPGYFEVYVDTPLATVEERDTKGFYAKARAGGLLNVVGLDIPWQAPQKPDITVYSVGTDAESIALQIIKAVPLLEKKHTDYFESR